MKKFKLKKSIILIFSIVMSITSVFVYKSFSAYTTEIKSVSIEQDNYGEDGTWKVEKSAEWTSNSTAEISFNVNSIKRTNGENKDIIFVIDTSGSMNGTKLSQVKTDSIELINDVLEDSNNRVSIITFDDESTIVSEFTNDADKLETLIDKITYGGDTNYNAAFINIGKVLNGYVKKNNRDTIVLFLTDGYPNIDTPSQVYTYQLLKSMYPYLIINGIQYEMGNTIASEIKEITDNQYVADQTNLKYVLYSTASFTRKYEDFTITDYIDNNYFDVESVDDIEVSDGTVELTTDGENQVVVWNLDNSYITGTEITMTIGVKLKTEYVTTYGYYSTNEKEIIESNFEGEEKISINSTSTPILKNNHTVTYDLNTPDGCTIDKTYGVETYYVYDTVTKVTDELSCNGYIFDGWEIEENDVEEINDNTFIMPSHDITIRATWTTPSIVKTMNGSVHEKTTLYKAAISIGTKYTKDVTDTVGVTEEATNVYYYNGDGSTNNVIFGGFCWKIVRTTQTKGVKLLYNGVPSNGECTATDEEATIGTSAFNTNANSLAYVGYMYNIVYKNEKSTLQFTNTNNILYSTKPLLTYYYADSYAYDELTGTYMLNNPYKIETNDDISTLEGKYSLMETTSDASKTYVYYITAVDGTSIYYYTIGSGNTDDSYYYYFYDDESYTNEQKITAPTWYTNYADYVGKYACGTTQNCATPVYVTSTTKSNYTYFNPDYNNLLYGNSVTYDGSTGNYTLTDTIKLNGEIYSDLSSYGARHYTCFNTTGTCSSVYYIYNSNNYYITLINGKNVEDAISEMLFADDVNTYDSTIKTYIDNWYVSNMTEYTNYLEDVVYCNDRSINTLGNWDSTSTLGLDVMHFIAYFYTDNAFLTCSNITDQFSVDNNKAKLTYPIGLLTSGEARLLSQINRKIDKWWWLISPGASQNDSTNLENAYIYQTGVVSHYTISKSLSVRPTISLKPGTEYTSGDGSYTNPFVVETD